MTLTYRKANFTRLNQQNHDLLIAMQKRSEVEMLRSSNIKEIADEAGDRTLFSLKRNIRIASSTV